MFKQRKYRLDQFTSGYLLKFDFLKILIFYYIIKVRLYLIPLFSYPHGECVQSEVIVTLS